MDASEPRSVEALLGLAPLGVGDRVRFTPRLECRMCWGSRAERDGSPEDFDGQWGVIVEVRPSERSSHPYMVRAFPDLSGKWSPFGVWECARTEIEAVR